MTREEAIKMLSILKAAYPNSYKGMTKDEANGTINIWAMQFASMPFAVVQIAVNKLISTNTFPPTINEVKQKIRSLYWEAWEMKRSHESSTVGIKLDEDDDPIYIGKTLDAKTLALVEDIIRICEPMRTQERLEPSLGELLAGFNTYLSAGDSDRKQLN